MLPGNSSQGLSQSCISAISTVTPPSVCTNEAETALRKKGREKFLASKISHQGWSEALAQFPGTRNLPLSADLRANTAAKSHPWAAQDSLMHKWAGLPAGSALLVPRGEALRAPSFPVYRVCGCAWPQAPGSALSHPSVLSEMCSERALGRPQRGPELQRTSRERCSVSRLSHRPPLALPVGSGASFCALHADPMEPIGTAPLSDPTVRNGSAWSVRLLPEP